MDYNKFTIESGGLETISDLEKERCFESALNQIKDERKHHRWWCYIRYRYYNIIYKELKEFLEANNYMVCICDRPAPNGYNEPYILVEWVYQKRGD